MVLFLPAYHLSGVAGSGRRTGSRMDMGESMRVPLAEKILKLIASLGNFTTVSFQMGYVFSILAITHRASTLSTCFSALETTTIGT